MFCEDVCLGPSCGADKLRAINDSLNADVIEQVNETEELIMISNFMKESNEYMYKKCLEDRMSDVASWRWVLEDLSKRLAESIDGLNYEDKALRVVVQRILDEIRYHCNEGTKPGAICPVKDSVECAITQEQQFLKEQKKHFERLILELEKQTSTIVKVKNRIDIDIANKAQALDIDEMCANKDYGDVVLEDLKKKRSFPVACWVKRCTALKRAGLKSLCNAMTTKQQIKGARVQLSISAQACAARVDAVLRRRQHTNRIKMEDLKWQKKEALRDCASLDQELLIAEKTLLDVMDKERIAEARVGDRTQRPGHELTKDDVNRKLRQEQTQLRKFGKQLRNNIKRILNLQNNLRTAITHIDCYMEDLKQVISLDEKRICNREGEVINKNNSSTTPSAPPYSSLTVIREEDEDDYPFDF